MQFFSTVWTCLKKYTLFNICIINNDCNVNTFWYQRKYVFHIQNMITHIDILKLHISDQYQKLKNILQCLMHDLHCNTWFIWCACTCMYSIKRDWTHIDRGIKQQSYPYWLFYCLNWITVQIIGVGRNWICHKYKPESLWFV